MRHAIDIATTARASRLDLTASDEKVGCSKRCTGRSDSTSPRRAAFVCRLRQSSGAGLNTHPEFAAKVRGELVARHGMSARRSHLGASSCATRRASRPGRREPGSPSSWRRARSSSRADDARTSSSAGVWRRLGQDARSSRNAGVSSVPTRTTAGRAAFAAERSSRALTAARRRSFAKSDRCACTARRLLAGGAGRERTRRRRARSFAHATPSPRSNAGPNDPSVSSTGMPPTCAMGADHWKISVVQSPPWRRTSWARAGPSGRSWKSTKKSGSISMPPSGAQLTRSSHERSPG